MTKDVIAMAREAGLFTHKEVQPEIIRFATLVGNAALDEALHIVKNHFDYTRSEAVEAIESLKEPTT